TPLDMLLSKEYAAQRRKLIDPRKASLEMRPGHGPKSNPEDPPSRRIEDRRSRIEDRGSKNEDEDDLSSILDPPSSSFDHDTTHTCAADIHGNMIAATTSGGWIPSSPVIPGLGFPMGTRGQMFYLDPHHASALVPRKRPRTTLTPSLVLKDGKP